jgi:hypothetical protein
MREMHRNIKETVRIRVTGVRKYGPLVIWASREGQPGLGKIICPTNMWVPHVRWMSIGYP